MDIRPIKATKLYEGVIDYILNLINSGEIRPGQKLPTENEFMDTLKVSKGVLREAFRVLEYQGIIETRPGEGRYMRSIITQDNETYRDCDEGYKKASLVDICECRQMIEPGIIRLAVKRATAKDIDALSQINILMRNAISNNMETDLDLEFHMAICRAAHNIVLLESMQKIVNTLNNIDERSALRYQAWRSLCLEHQDILEAIASRDENRAVYTMRLHLLNLKNAVMEKEV